LRCRVTEWSITSPAGDVPAVMISKSHTSLTSRNTFQRDCVSSQVASPPPPCPAKSLVALAQAGGPPLPRPQVLPLLPTWLGGAAIREATRLLACFRKSSGQPAECRMNSTWRRQGGGGGGLPHAVGGRVHIHVSERVPRTLLVGQREPALSSRLHVALVVHRRCALGTTGAPCFK
jgi:hypothetical protein